MKIFSPKTKYSFFMLFYLRFSKLYAKDYSLNKSLIKDNPLLNKSIYQRLDLRDQNIFADGGVIRIMDEEFFTTSNQSIIYKLIGKIKLVGNVEVITHDLIKVKVAEVIFFLKEKKIEAISNFLQRVTIKYFFNETNKPNSSKER